MIFQHDKPDMAGRHERSLAFIRALSYLKE